MGSTPSSSCKNKLSLEKSDQLKFSGYLFIVDRKKSLIIRGGENISTLEVENALDRHPSILESCVCGIDDPKFGEIVGAYIYCNADVSEEAIKEFLVESIAGYKVPEVLHISKDPLPRIATEKIDKLKENFYPLFSFLLNFHCNVKLNYNLN